MNVGVVAGLALLLAAPAVHGLVLGSTSPLEASLRLLAAVLAAMVGEVVLRRLLSPADGAAGEGEADPGGAPGIPRQRRSSAPRSAPPARLPEPVAERLRNGPGGPGA